jgi:acetyl/propionyl-CoA carboxylase alpha subunit
VQRNNQKVLEESESVMLPDDLEQAAYDHARRLADAIDYLGAGTVEFIFDLVNNALYFMEMNTRLQVEHPVTEWTTGISIVDTQFRIAEGESIESMEINRRGYAIEARVTAEKGVRDAAGNIDFVPTPGTLDTCVFPEWDDIEVIAAIGPGKTVSPFYDSLVAQIIAYGDNREDGLRKLKAYLEAVEIKGICTNIPVLTRVLEDEIFVKGEFDTGYLPGFLRRTDADNMLAEMEATGASGDATSIEIDGSKELKVLSPQTGIFYATASPSDPPYVKPGDKIGVEKTLCQIEAMKMFTSVSLSSFNGDTELYPSSRHYKVVRVNQANGAQVNAGDLLFVIKPI